MDENTTGGQILAAFEELEVEYLVYIPCSTARPILDRLVPKLGPRAFVASVESEGVAIATGLALAGRRAVLMMQDTGLGNAITVLTTLPRAYHVPLFIFATRTGGLREINAVVHEYADGVPAMLDACRVPRFELDYRVTVDLWRSVAVEAFRTSRLSRRPVVMLAHIEALALIAEAFADDPLVSSCGVSSRELASLGRRDNHLYLLNSMGAVGPTALGLALGLDGRIVAAVEGDGGFLMGLGALATIAMVRPRGLVWIVVDNGVHCSTGGQPTAATRVDLGELARAAGLPTLRVEDREGLEAALDEARRLAADGPVFLHVRTATGAAATPYFQPDAAVLTARFQAALRIADS